jgi:ATP-binding cassette subfamily G (WHITE) protein 2
MSGRKSAGDVTGRVFIGQIPVTKELLKSFAAYVEQYDTLLGTLTVRETLLYHAELKGDPDEPADERVDYVDSLIKDLKLASCKDVIVEDLLNRCISGGQAKRTNIGISLVTRPRILFLDEPTSGLDSQTSLDVMMVMRGLANGGVNVVATVHSPTSEAFRNFDHLLMLRAGRVTYCGPLFGHLGAAQYFENLGLVKYDPQENLADYLISTVAIQSEDMDFAEAFAESEHAKANSHAVGAALQDILMKRYEVESEQLFGTSGGGGKFGGG